MKWMVNGNETGKIFKTFLICCVLGKYNPSYSYLFCGSDDIVEMNFQFVKYLFQFLLLLNFDRETYHTQHMSFLNYLLIIRAKLGDPSIIIIVIF